MPLACASNAGCVGMLERNPAEFVPLAGDQEVADRLILTGNEPVKRTNGASQPRCWENSQWIPLPARHRR